MITEIFNNLKGKIIYTTTCEFPYHEGDTIFIDPLDSSKEKVTYIIKQVLICFAETGNDCIEMTKRTLFVKPME